jgi:23S rRNA (guanosine2251-2'-O)-methyltransferase
MKTRDILYGIHPVREAIRAGRRRIDSVIFLPGKLTHRLAEIRGLAAERGIPVETAPPDHLRAKAGSSRHQGVIAEAAPYEFLSTKALPAASGNGSEAPFLLVADCITDPMNLGALLRTALAVGVHAVITPRDRSAPPTPAVSSASAGALEHIRLVQATNLVRILQTLKEKGVWIFGLDHRARQDCFQADLSGPMALVIGGEGKGIRPLVKKTCDHLVSIPQQGAVASLNASVAGAVVMYEAYRQRIAIEQKKE